MSEHTSPFLESLPAPPEVRRSASEEAERRRRLSAHIQAMSSQLKGAEIRKIRVRRWTAVAFAAAASLGLWWGSGLDGVLVPAQPFDHAQPSSTDAASSHLADPAQLIVGKALHADGSLLAPSEKLETAGRLFISRENAASFVLGSGAEVKADPGTIFELRRHQEAGRSGENIDLIQGAVSLSVPKLSARQRLTVSTAEATVEVRGTEFSVSREQSQSVNLTSVTVDEGLVAVRPISGPELLLRAGDSWESSRGGPSVTGAASPPIAELSRPHPRESSAANAPIATAEKMLAASHLAEQNRIYQAALHAQRNGLNEAARTRFLELLSRYPDSPLASSAQRQLGILEDSEKP